MKVKISFFFAITLKSIIFAFELEIIYCKILQTQKSYRL